MTRSGPDPIPGRIDATLNLAFGVFAAAILWLYVYRGGFHPDYGYDEAMTYLGVMLLQGSYGLPIDPMGNTAYSRYYAMEVYPPVFYVAAAFVYQLLDFGLVQTRLAASLFRVGTAALIFMAVRREAGAGAGALAAAIYLAIDARMTPLVVGRPDASLTFFYVASGIALLAAVRRPHVLRFFAAGFLYALAPLSHFVGLLAGVLFAAVLLWHFGWRFPLRARYWAYVVGFALPWVAYGYLLYPYHFTVVRSLIGYGIENPDLTGWMAFGPVRYTLQHLTQLHAMRPHVLYGFLPAAVALAAAGFLARGTRFAPPRLLPALALAFVLMFFVVGTYPNIGVYVYYAPLYLVLVGPLAALTLAWIAKGRLGAAALGLVGFSAMAVGGLEIGRVVRAELASVEHRRLAPISEWTAATHRRGEYVLGSPGFVFSSIGGDIRAWNVVGPARDGTVGVVPSLAAAVPEFPTIDDFVHIVEDQWLQMFMIAKPRGTMPPHHAILDRFQVSSLVRDNVSQAGNANLLSRVRPGEPVLDWPELATIDRAGYRRLRVDAACVVSVAMDMRLERDASHPELTAAVRKLALPGIAKPRAIALRVAAERQSADGGAWLGTALHLYDVNRFDQVRRAAHARQQPWVAPKEAMGTFGPQLPGGEFGRVLMTHLTPGNSNAVFAVLGTAEADVKRVDVAWLLDRGETCDGEAMDGLRTIAADLGGSAPIRVISMPPVVPLGRTFEVVLSRPVEHIDLLLYTRGRYVRTIPFGPTDRVTLSLDEPGVWSLDLYLGPPNQPGRPVVGGPLTVR